MISLHLPTVSVFSAILTAFMGLATIWVWSRDREETALASWGLSRLASAAGSLLLGLRGMVPDWASIDIANALLCLSLGLTWAGTRQFEGRRVLPWVVVTAAALWLLACRLPQFRADIEIRVMLIALLTLVYHALTLAELIRGHRALPLPSRPIFIGLLAGATLLYLAATAFTLSSTPALEGRMPTVYWLSAFLLLNILLTAGGTLILVALVKEKAQLRATAALAAARDAADRASFNKSQFLARMSHELRTPLNAVLGLAQLLARDGSLGPDQRRKATTLEESGRHLLAILNDVLDLTRIEAGRFLTTPAPLPLRSGLDATLALMRDAAATQRVGLALMLDPALPPVIAVDALRLRQILMNLLANAIRYSPPGGAVELAVTGGEGRIQLSVTDAGRGIPAELRPHLFEEFAQSSDDEARQGSGLGLAISAALARAMGGGLTHEDGPDGLGSRFTLTLPLTVAEAAPAPALPETPAAGTKALRVLVVDDIATNRIVAAELLRSAGHKPCQAASGLAALAVLEKEPLPDLVLMDQRMPGLDGSETVRRIRAMEGPVADLPIIALTADVMPEQIAQMMGEGFDDHLAKPVDRAQLLAKAERWGAGR